MKTSTKIIILILLIVIIGRLDMIHYQYKVDKAPMSFTEYLIGGYYYRQTDADKSPYSALYRGF